MRRHLQNGGDVPTAFFATRLDKLPELLRRRRFLALMPSAIADGMRRDDVFPGIGTAFATRKQMFGGGEQFACLFFLQSVLLGKNIEAVPVRNHRFAAVVAMTVLQCCRARTRFLNPFHDDVLCRCRRNAGPDISIES